MPRKPKSFYKSKPPAQPKSVGRADGRAQAPRAEDKKELGHPIPVSHFTLKDDGTIKVAQASGLSSSVVSTDEKKHSQRGFGGTPKATGEPGMGSIIFTPRAIQAMLLGRNEARRLKHNYLGTEHLLFGLIELGQGVAVNILKKHGLNLKNVRAEIERQSSPASEEITGNIPYTPRTKKVLARAHKEAQALGHTYTGTEHLLLGLLAETDGMAWKIFKMANVDFEKTREEILAEITPVISTQKCATDDEAFLKQFESAAWPVKDWHHRQHIKVAYLYLRQYGLETAATKIRDGIKAYNAAHKVPEAIDRGYHETMTQAWLRLVHFVLQEYGPAENAEAFFEAHPELWQTKTLRLFYSREKFLTAEAKTNFIEPDITPLPVSRKN